MLVGKTNEDQYKAADLRRWKFCMSAMFALLKNTLQIMFV